MVSPFAVAENTINKRVCGVTAIFRFVVMPPVIAPSEINPASEGVNVTIAPGIGVKILLGVVD